MEGSYDHLQKLWDSAVDNVGFELPLPTLVNVEDCGQFGVPWDQILSTIYNIELGEGGMRLNSTAVSNFCRWL